MHDTLFVLRRTRDFQTLLPTVGTLSVAWVNEICCDTYGNWLFFFIIIILQHCSVSTISTFIFKMDGCIFMGSFIFCNRYSGTFKMKNLYIGIANA